MINGAQTYTTLNANAGTTIINTLLGSGGSTVNVGANLTFGVSEKLTALNIGAGGRVILAAAPSPAPEDSAVVMEGIFADFDQAGIGGSPLPALPEPNAFGLVLLGALGFFRRRAAAR